jgi:pentatricopeptide repeat protein
VHAYNAALAADAVLRPEEVERLALAGTHRLEFTAANPWALLVRLYTRQGRMDEALAALREMQNFRRQQPPQLRDQVRADADATFAEVLLVAAEADTGMRVMDRAMERPDRRGLTVTSAEQVMGAHALLRRAMRRTQAELDAERRSYSGALGEDRRGKSGGLEGIGQRAARRFAGIGDGERIRSVSANDDRLRATFRLFVHGGLEPIPPWLLGDLIEVLGPGIVAGVLDGLDESEPMPGLIPYRQALEAELSLALGEPERSLELARASLELLPDSEGLLRARVAAVAATAAARTGKRRDADEFLSELMQRDAGTLRRRGMSLPVRIDDGASGDAHEVLASMLEDSPRLELERDASFVVEIRGQGDELEICLVGPDRTELSCVAPRWPELPTDPGAKPPIAPEPAPPMGEIDEVERTPRAYARLAAAEFHDRAFVMSVGLSNVDLGSLDGSATMSAENTREKARALLDSLAEGS